MGRGVLLLLALLLYLILSSLELSDTKVYERFIRTRLGTTLHFCKVVVLCPRTTFKAFRTTTLQKYAVVPRRARQVNTGAGGGGGGNPPLRWYLPRARMLYNEYYLISVK